MKPSPQLPWSWRLAGGYIRRELPGWGRLYALLGGNDDARWRDAGLATMRGKLHGYRIPCDLGNWSERLSWFLGRYHDLPLQLAMQTLLRRGDTFVDIGANLGMLSLLASRLVGPGGHVLACEPNPRLGERLEVLARDNAIDQLRVFCTALGAAAAQAELHEFAGHSGWGSLVPQAPAGAAETASWRVPVATGDELLAGLPVTGSMVLKIDVEGYEVPVLDGLQRTLAEHAPLVIVELIEDSQRRAGYSLAELGERLERHGYRGFYLWHRRHRLLRRRLELLPIADYRGPATDGLFVPSHGALADRLAAWRRG